MLDVTGIAQMYPEEVHVHVHVHGVVHLLHSNVYDCIAGIFRVV